MAVGVVPYSGVTTPLSTTGRLALGVVCEQLEAHLAPLQLLVVRRSLGHYPCGRDEASIETRRARRGHLARVSEAVDYFLNRLIERVALLEAELHSLGELLQSA